MLIKKSIILSALLLNSISSLFATEECMQLIQAEYECASKVTAIQSFFGEITVNSEHNPTLYGLVCDTAQMMGMQIPKHVTIAKNSIFIGVIGSLQCKSISIGSELIKNLTYEELQSIIIDRLGYVKHDTGRSWITHTKEIVTAAFPMTIIEVLGERMDWKHRTFYASCVGGTIGAMWELQYIRKVEEGAAREVIRVTKNKKHFINALQKIVMMRSDLGFIKRLANESPAIDRLTPILDQELQKLHNL